MLREKPPNYCTVLGNRPPLSNYLRSHISPSTYNIRGTKYFELVASARLTGLQEGKPYPSPSKSPVIPHDWQLC